MTTGVTMLIPVIGDYSLTAGVIGVLGYVGFVAHSLRSRDADDDAAGKKDDSSAAGTELSPAGADVDVDVDEEHGEPEPVAKGAAYLVLGGGLIFLYADDFIDSVAGIARAWGVSSTLLAFFLAPIASEAPEILEAVMLSRKGYTQTINIALSNLVGGTISKTTLLFGIFNFYGVYKNFAWESPNYAVSIVLLSASAALSACTVAMQRDVPLWRGYLLWAAFVLTGIVQYKVTTEYV
jgi:Ca2+/Na+ antiporter